MSDDKQTKEVKDDELDKVSGGTGDHSMSTGLHEDGALGHKHSEGAGSHRKEFGAGSKQFTK
jgi:hypothetical protein